MATTRTVFNWPVPEAGDFLKVGWAAIQNLADSIAATIVALTALPVASLRQSTAQTGLGAGWQLVSLQSEDIDSHNGHDLITNNSRWTCPTGQGGTYRVDGGVVFGALAVDTTYNSRITKNNAVFVGSTGTSVTIRSAAAAAGLSSTTGSKIITMVPGDYIELQAFANQANWSTGVFTDGACWMNVERIR